MSDPPIVTRSQLVRDLRNLGLAEGQTLMLHASVKAIGWVVGGPDVVLQALLDVLTPAGTLMMLASWEDNPYDLARWPEQRRQAYLEECPPFDPAASRADHRNMSILAEYLRTWPGACRSRHPFSFVALGEKAEWITRDHPWQYNDGPGSPLAKLCEADGLVLLLGELLGNVTLTEHAHHFANVPDKRIDRYQMPVLQDGKRVWMEFENYDTTLGIVDWPGDYGEAIVRDYLAAGNGHTGKVGAARSYLFEAPPLVKFAVQWMEEHFAKKTP